MNWKTRNLLTDEERLFERLTNLIEKGEPRKAISERQREWWMELRENVINRINEIKENTMKNELITSKYCCKVCGNTVEFSTNATDLGAFMMGAPADLCLTGLNYKSREMVAALKCAKCFKG